MNLALICREITDQINEPKIKQQIVIILNRIEYRINKGKYNLIISEGLIYPQTIQFFKDQGFDVISGSPYNIDGALHIKW